MHELGQGVLPVQVDAVAGGVLGDEDQLFGAVCHQAFALLLDALHGSAAVAAPDEGDGAVGAAVVAALGDFYIGEVAGGGELPVAAQGHAGLVREGLHIGVLLHHLGEEGGDVPVGADAQDGVGLGELCVHLLLVALGQAAGDDQLFDLALFFEGGQL